MLRLCTSSVFRSYFTLYAIFSCYTAVLVSSDAVLEHSFANISGSNGIFGMEFTFEMEFAHTSVSITDFPPSSSFSVIHVHSFPKNIFVTVQYPLGETTLNGSDVGFVHSTARGDAMFLVSSPFPTHVEIFIAVRAYDESYPVPGGCAMEFPIEVAPYLMIENENETVSVKGQKGAESLNDQLCLNNDLEYEFYYIYTTESFEFASEHFKFLQTMLNYSTIVEKAYKARWMDGSPTQRVFAKYPGVCTYYAMAVRGPLGRVSLYSPSSSLLCLQTEGPPLSFSRKVLIGTLLPIGMILCFAGHSMLHVSVFFTTFFAGQTVSYVGFVSSSFTPDDAHTYAAFVALAIAGIVCVLMIYCCGPFFSAAVCSIGAGYLLFAALFYIFAGNSQQFTSGLNYWGMTIVLIMVFGGIMLGKSKFSCMAATSFTGSYLITYVLDYIFQTHVKYLTINPVRRLTVEGFNTAITYPVLENQDMVMFGVWISLTVIGFIKQERRSRGRAPFPPPPRLFSLAPSLEQEPLLPADRETMGHRFYF